MKISNSKKELAKIISENGGWRDGADSCSCDNDGYVNFFKGKPTRSNGSWLDNGDCEYLGGIITPKYEKVKNWHQTIISRAEYFHLYPEPDADGWIELNEQNKPIAGTIVNVIYGDGRREDNVLAGGYSFTYTGGLGVKVFRLHKSEHVETEYKDGVKPAYPAKVEYPSKPTIEELAADYRNKLAYADRKQDEAYKANMESDKALSELEKAIAEIGFTITPIGAVAKEPELVITDWRDLRHGDIIEYVDGLIKDRIGMTGPVVEFSDNANDGMFVRLRCDNGPNEGVLGWPTKWRFIRRPAK